MNRVQIVGVALAIAASPLTIVGPAAAGQMSRHAEVVASPVEIDFGGLPQCRYEDGSDIDGFCYWVDPDTGDVYVNPTSDELGYV